VGSDTTREMRRQDFRLFAGLDWARDKHDAVAQDAQGLQSYVGTAPVCFQSGSSRRVKLRRACNKWLRTAVHLWANQSRFKCDWASVYYQKKRQEGKSHATALRCLGQRWLKTILRMWQGRCPYDEGLHLQSMIRRCTWALQLPAQT